MTISSPNKLEIKGKPKGIMRISNKVKVAIIILFTIITSLIAFGITSSSNRNIQVKTKDDNANTRLEPAIEVAKHFIKDISDHQVANTEKPLAEVKTVPASLTKHEPTSEDEFAKKVKEQQLQDGLRARMASTNHESFNSHVNTAEQAVSNSNSGNSNTNNLSGTAIEGYREISQLQLAKDDHNKQLRKAKFLKSAIEEKDNDYLDNLKKAPISRYEVKAGQIIPAIMISGINSDLPGQLIAQVRENVYDTVSGNHLLIPQGTKLIGTYDSQIAYGQERLLIVWNRLIFPDGASLNIQAMPGADVAGYAGLHDQVNNHFFKTFSSAILMSMITAGAQLSQPQMAAAGNQVPTPSQAIAGSVGAQLGQTSNNLIQRNLNVQPTLEIRSGYLFNVMVNKDMVLG